MIKISSFAMIHAKFVTKKLIWAPKPVKNQQFWIRFKKTKSTLSEKKFRTSEKNMEFIPLSGIELDV